jgi:hypothetical protein
MEDKQVQTELSNDIPHSPTRCEHGKLRSCPECLIDELAALRSLMLRPEAKDLIPVKISNALMRRLRIAAEKLTKMRKEHPDRVSCLQTPTRNRFD